MNLDINDILKREPWHIAYVNIGQRCHNPNHPKYKFYGGKGVTRAITSDELKRMYFRDKAFLMKSPSVDRIDPDTDYCFDNCRFIEMDENRKLANDRRTASRNAVDIEKLRDLMCKFNRASCPASELSTKEIEDIFSPPFKGTESRTKEYPYPPQLAGVRTNPNKRRVRVQIIR